MNNLRGPSGPFFMLCFFLLTPIIGGLMAQSLEEHKLSEIIHRESNELRLNKKRTSLERNALADSLAYVHALNMAEGKARIGHKNFKSRANILLENGAIAVYENVWYGLNYPVERAIVDWLKSSGHKKNLLQKEVNKTGIGLVKNDQGEIFLCVLYLLTDD